MPSYTKMSQSRKLEEASISNAGGVALMMVWRKPMPPGLFSERTV
jgi:hypothetical protein